MTATLSDRLRTVEVLETHSSGGVQVFGLRWPLEGGPPYRTLDEALAAGTLEVTEITEGGSVPLLKVFNRGAEPVFLMAGEQLVGAKQNRILNTSLLVPAGSELTVPVELRRGGTLGLSLGQVRQRGNMSHGKLRKLLSGHVHDSYRDARLAGVEAGRGLARGQPQAGPHEVGIALESAATDLRRLRGPGCKRCWGR